MDEKKIQENITLFHFSQQIKIITINKIMLKIMIQIIKMFFFKSSKNIEKIKKTFQIIFQNIIFPILKQL